MTATLLTLVAILTPNHSHAAYQVSSLPSFFPSSLSNYICNIYISTQIYMYMHIYNTFDHLKYGLGK